MSDSAPNHRFHRTADFAVRTVKRQGVRRRAGFSGKHEAMGKDGLKEISAGYEDLAKLSAAASFSYFMTMFKGLNKDTRKCLDFCGAVRDQLLKKDSQTEELFEDLNFWYRALVRSFVTEVEGMLFVMRQIVVWASEREEIVLSTAEAALVREQEFSINVKRKRIEERSRSNRFLENFYLTFSLFPRVFRSTFEVDYGAHGWEMFQRVVSARNSMTHPKNVSDLVLPSDIYNALSDAISWFYGSIHDLLEHADREFLERSHAETSLDPRLHELRKRFAEAGEPEA